MNTQVIEFLTNNPNSNKGQIADAVNLRGLGLFNLLKKMVNEEQIIIEGEGHDSIYRVAATETASEEHAQVKTLNETLNGGESGTQGVKEKNEEPVEGQTERPSKAEAKPDKKQPGRSNGTFKFNDVSYNKGKLIQAVVSHYCSTRSKITHDKLKEVFPDTLLKRFGIYQTVEKAREISGAKYDRYFFKDELQIKIKDAVIVTSNQITSDNILPFLEACRNLGYVIEAE